MGPLWDVDVVRELKDFFRRTPEGRAIIEKREERIADERRNLIKRLVPLRTKPNTTKLREVEAAAQNRVFALEAELKVAREQAWLASTAAAAAVITWERAVGGTEAQLRASAPECVGAFVSELRAEHAELVRTSPRLQPGFKEERKLGPWVAGRRIVYSATKSIQERLRAVTDAIREAEAIAFTAATEAESEKAIAGIRARLSSVAVVAEEVDAA